MPGFRSDEWHLSAVLPRVPDDPPGVVGHFQAIHGPTSWLLTGEVGELDGTPVILSLNLKLISRDAAANLGHSVQPETGDSIVSNQLLESISVPQLCNEMVARVARELSQRSRGRRQKGPTKEWPEGSIYELLARGSAEKGRREANLLRSFPKERQARGGRPSLAEQTARGLLAFQDEHAGRNLVLRYAESVGEDIETMRSRVKTSLRKGFLTSTARPGAEGAYLPGPELIDRDQPKEKP